MSNPCKLDDTTQNKIAYAMGYEDGRNDTIDGLRELMIHNADQKGIDAFDKSVEEMCHR